MMDMYLLSEEPSYWLKDMFESPLFTGIGTLASIVGIIITIYQVSKTRRTSDTIKEEVSETKKDIAQFLDIVSLTKMNDEVELARENIKNDSFEVACTRLSELKKFLWEYKVKASESEQKSISRIITHLSSDIIVLSNPDDGDNIIDKNTLLEHLNTMNDLLSEWSGKLKRETI